MCVDFGSNSCNSRGAIFARIQLLCAAMEEKKNDNYQKFEKYIFKNL